IDHYTANECSLIRQDAHRVLKKLKESEHQGRIIKTIDYLIRSHSILEERLEQEKTRQLVQPTPQDDTIEPPSSKGTQTDFPVAQLSTNHHQPIPSGPSPSVYSGTQSRLNKTPSRTPRHSPALSPINPTTSQNLVSINRRPLLPTPSSRRLISRETTAPTHHSEQSSERPLTLPPYLAAAQRAPPSQTNGT